jgi:hypothetical protein
MRGIDVPNRNRNVTTGCEKQLHFPMPDKMLRAYKHSTNEHRALFNSARERLTEAGLVLYPTNCPDLRAKQPQNDIVFVILGFQEVAGTRVEVRVDSVPKTIWSISPALPRRIAQYDRLSRARWAVYNLASEEPLERIMCAIGNVSQTRPAWGNHCVL